MLTVLHLGHPSHPLGTYARRAARAIIATETGSIHFDDPSLFVDCDDLFNQLIASQVFAYQPWSQSLKFESRRVEEAVRAKLEAEAVKAKLEAGRWFSSFRRRWSPSQSVAPESLAPSAQQEPLAPPAK